MAVERSLYDKAPGERLDYVRNWAPKLGEDTIATSEWTAADDGITVGDSTKTNTTTTVFVTGGTLGHVYKVTNKITTAGGRILEFTFRFRVKAK